MHTKKLLTAGHSLKDAEKVLVMLHGRGGSAEDILSLAAHLQVQDYALLAPEATGNSWYPYSFLAPPEANEPWLGSALNLLQGILHDITATGIRKENIYLTGFSQGACLALEFAARNATGFGGVAAFTGGLIGDIIYRKNYSGNFAGTPVFIGSSDPDAHVPVQRVNETADVLREMNASVTVKLFRQMGHTINQDEIELANKLVFAPAVTTQP